MPPAREAGRDDADGQMRTDDLVPPPLDLVHHDQARRLKTLGRVAEARQLTGQRHREAAAVRGREQFLRARLVLGLRDARRVRVGQSAERARSGRDRAGAAGEVPLPDDLGDALDPRHQFPGP